VRAVVSPGPDRAGRRGRLALSAAITGILGGAGVVYGIVVGLTPPIVIGVLLLLATFYTLVVLRGLVRRDR
jgi:Flp pilus assembly protein TadB